MTDEKGEISTRDIPTILGGIKCSPSMPASNLPTDHNARVMAVRKLFAEEVKHRQTEQRHSLSLSHGQKYALRELRAFVSQLEEADDRRGPAAILERAFRSSALTSAAKKELTALRRNSVVGENLYRALLKVYDQYRLREQTVAEVTRSESQVPRVICSEGLA